MTTLYTLISNLESLATIAENKREIFLRKLYASDATKIDIRNAHEEFRYSLKNVHAQNNRLRTHIDSRIAEEQKALLPLMHRIAGIY